MLTNLFSEFKPQSRENSQTPQSEKKSQVLFVSERRLKFEAYAVRLTLSRVQPVLSMFLKTGDFFKVTISVRGGGGIRLGMGGLQPYWSEKKIVLFGQNRCTVWVKTVKIVYYLIF